MTHAEKSSAPRQSGAPMRRPNTSHWSRTPSQWVILAVWILAVHGCAIYLFTTGFFLTRFELKSSSECSVFPDTHRNLTDPGQFPALQNLKQSGGCWYPPRFRKLVVIVIDALRFDFVAPFDKEGALDPAGPAPGPQKIEKESDEVLYYRNTLPIIHETLRNQPDKSHLFQFIADPPTVTMQRLKGLTTGGLPSFLDIKDNFDSSAVQEDNIVRQWKKQNRSSVFMGDDTWVSLFPKEFTQAYSYPSFNVKDLYTVDNGCIEHLLPELTTNKWDILISHFLGVDHVGHTYQANHPMMRSKLSQMNGIVTDVIRAVDRSPHANDTLFLLLGDHGMTPDGNHGGNSNSETVAAMFAYSPGAPFTNLKQLEATVKHYEQKLMDQGKIGRTSQAPEEQDDSAASTRCPSAQYSSSSSLLSRPGVQTDLYSQIPQIDLVPTLSLLMGVPIPFNSLGSLVPELFMSGSGDGTAGSHIQSLRSLIQALHINSWQLHRYLEEYSTTAESFPYAKMSELQTYFRDANELFDHLFPPSDSSRAQTHNTVDCDRGSDEACVLEHHRLAMLYRQFLTVSATMCREKWTTFNIGLMHWGCVILVLLAASHAFFLYMHHASMSDSLSLLTTNPDSLGNAYLLDRTLTDGAPRRPGATKWRGFLLRPLVYGLLGALTGLSIVSGLVVTDQVRLLGISNAVEARSAQHRSHPTGDMLMPAFIMKFSLPLFTIACGVGSSVGWLIGLTQIWIQRRRKLALLRSSHTPVAASATAQGSTLTRTTAVSETPAQSGEKADPRTWWTNALRYFAFFCFSIYMQGLFSNSFIMHEARLSLFLTVSLTVAYTVASASGVAPVTRWPFAMRSSATRIVVPIIVFLVLCRLTASITWLFKGPFSFPEEFISLTSSTLNSLQALQSPALHSTGSYPLWKCILFGVRVYIPLLLFPLFLRRFVLLRYSPQRRDSFSASSPAVTTMAVSPAAVYPSPSPAAPNAFFPPAATAASSSLLPLTRAQVRRWICNFVVPVSCVCIVIFWNYHFCADPRDHTRPPPGVIPAEALASAAPSAAPSAPSAPTSSSPFARVDAKTVDWLPRFVYFSCLSAMALLMYCEDPATPFPALAFSATASSADIADAKGYERVRSCYCLSDAMSTDLICFMALLMLLLALMIGSLFPLIAGVIISYLLSLTSAPATHFSSARYAVSRALGSTAVFIVRVLSSCNFSFFEAMLAVFLGLHIFFSTGHDNKFETLQVSAPFVGFENFTVPRAIAMTLCNTFVGQILVLVGMPLTIALRSRLTYGLVLQTWRRLKAGEEVKDTGAESIVEDESEEQALLGDHFISPIEPEALTRNVMFMHCVKGLLTFSFFYCIRVALSAINVTIQRRHLMVWAVFAPKYVFDAASVLTMDILIIIALLLSWRFTRSAVVNTNTPAPLPSLVVSLSNDTKSKRV